MPATHPIVYAAASTEQPAQPTPSASENQLIKSKSKNKSKSKGKSDRWTLLGSTKKSVASDSVSGASAKPKNEKPKQPATKQFLIQTAPAILTVHLKRFEQDGYRLRKSSAKVSFPLELDLAPFVARYLRVMIHY